MTATRTTAARQQALHLHDSNADDRGEATGVALASGDLNADGSDEIVLTWPSEDFYSNDWPDLVRTLQVISITEENSITADKVIGDYGGNEWSRDSFLDTLVVGDFDRDLSNEIAWLHTRADNDFDAKLEIFEFSPPDTPEAMGTLTPVSGSGIELDLSAFYSVHMVAGNFTQEGVRVGRPSYRVQNRVDTMLALINMPPKHQDIVKDASGEYQVIKSPDETCVPSPDSPNCTHAKYATEDFESAEQELTTKHTYSLSAGIATEACAGGGIGVAEVNACVRNSISYTHGGNFEKTATQLSSTVFRRKVIAATDDKIVYFGTPYGVWEYPVLADSSEAEASYFTVAFPLVSMTPFPSTAGGYNNGFCDETWFHAEHQPNNIWSYDPFGEILFDDYDENFSPVYDVIEGDWAEGAITYEHMQAVKSSQEFFC